MWFNSMQSEEPYPGLIYMLRILLKERGTFGNANTSGAWLSSARANDVHGDCGKEEKFEYFNIQVKFILLHGFMIDFELGENIELEDISESEKNAMRKMIIVAFWCIQMKPIHRPSMTKVLKMVESEDELLEIPPKSLVFSVDM
ncbi:hypothetical protein Goklo_025850 [Gossypium klotzschianum]|uniref:Serine-threonine/tyrosine-protein kinase catalytic domain-containing protein n=2 Tax=Gossypium TaxID=3633 RepID=A0A7J8TST4_9ROSI|nr:hypothetical protein [Gossypium klotzschianum]